MDISLSCVIRLYIMVTGCVGECKGVMAKEVYAVCT